MIHTGLLPIALGAAGVLGAAAIGTAVLLTSGPTSGASDALLQEATQTATPPSTASATDTPLVEGGSPSATPRPTPGVPSPAATPTASVDANGWPEISCPQGYSEIKIQTRKLTVCAPNGWRVRGPQEEDPAEGGPEGVITFSVRWTSPADINTYVAIGIASKESFGDRNSWNMSCALPETRPFLGHEAEFCFGTSSALNNMPINQPETWRLKLFVETDDFWLLGNATGTGSDSEIQRQLAAALSILDSATVSQLERVQ